MDLSDPTQTAENVAALNAAINERCDAGYAPDDPGIRLLQREIALLMCGEVAL